MTADNHPVVKDYIIPLARYPHLKETQTLHDAVQAIQEFTCGENNRLRYSEMLVVNERNQLVGRLSIENILEGLDKRLVEVPKVKGFEGKGGEYPNLSILWEDSFFMKCTEKKDEQIKGFMTPTDRLVKGSDSLLKALSIMLHTKEVILPVSDQERIIGVIRLEEIFKAICSVCKL
ncbi:MAG: CBS domain-containing protein [Proteobacteria bacterium]|nr:CBS domain-containing protein [Pseudomonadota bacterium]MBU1710713.1 CBS domain-containing protein [Pseudomonadota bacterium]